MELLEWTSRFIDYRNSFKRNLLKKEFSEKEIFCEYNNNTKRIYLVSEFLDDDIFKKINSEKITIVCLNSKKNVAFLIEKWDKFTKNKNLKIIFVNPKLNQQWSIVPYTHDLISDKTTLKLGIKSMFESVPAV